MSDENAEAVFNEINPVVPDIIVEEVLPQVSDDIVVEVKPEPEDRAVPLPTFLDMRDRATAAEKRTKELEQAQAEFNSKPQSVIDPFDDPEGYHRQQQEQLSQALTAQRFQTSELIAKQAYGLEVVDAAAVWAEEKAKSDPMFANAYMREAHPIEWIVQQHKRDGLVSQIPSDVNSMEEFIEREIAKRGLTAPIAAPAVQPVLKSAEPPRSIASDASPASNTVVDPTAEFNAIFQR